MPRIKGIYKKPKTQEVPNFGDSIYSVVQQIQELHNTKNEVIDAIDNKIEEVDKSIEIKINEVDDSISKIDAKVEEVNNTLIEAERAAVQMISDIRSIPQLKGEDGVTPEKGVDYFDGAPGKDAVVDEESIASLVLKKIPENKPSLKIIQESIDPQIIIDKIANITDKKVLKIKANDILDLSAIVGTEISRSKPYLHGGGDTVVAGTNITITTNANGAKVISSTGGGSGITLKTNGTDNGSQSILNLIAGTNITLTDNGLGGVTIDATGGGGTGDVVGPASAVDSNFAAFDTTTGKLIKDSGFNSSSFATPSDLGSYVPYTGATSTVDLQAQNLTFTSGNIGFNVGGVDEISISGLTSGILRFTPVSTFSGDFNFNSLTTNQAYTFPDNTGTIALTSDLSAYELLSNKSTSTSLGTSDTLYPTQNAVKTYADSLVAGLLDYRGGYDASVNTFPASGGSGTAGAVLKGDMWVVSVAGTLGGNAVAVGDSIIANVDTPGQTDANWNTLNTNITYVPEDVANKVTSLSGASTDTQYPSAKLVYDQLATKQSTISFGTGVQTALGVNVGSAGAPVLFNGALGTPSSGTVTNLTGTASININGTVGATTPAAGAFTTGSFSGAFVNSSTTPAIFSNSSVNNYNYIELRGGTAGTSVNWALQKDNTVANAFQLTPSTSNGGSTYTTPVLTITNTGATTLTGTLSVGTSNSITAGSLELGHASDTTISRVSAGVIAVEGNTVVTTAPGTSGNVLTSNGSAWVSSAPAASGATFWTALAGATRVGNTSFTVTGDQTALISKGMIIKWTESGTVRVAMVSIPSTYSSSTTVTIIGSTMTSIDSNSLKYAQVGAEPFVARFAIAGTIGATGTDNANTYYATEPMRVIGADLQVGTAGTTNSTTIDINKNGTTMFTTKPTLATTVATSPTPFTADSATSLALADRVSIDIDAVQTTAAVDLYAQLYLFPTRYLNLT